MECANGKLVAGNMLLVDPCVCSQKTTDVQDILLSSQLYADFKTGRSNKFESPRTWWSHYDASLLHAHWTVTEEQDDRRQPLGKATVSLEKLIEDHLLKRLTAAQATSFRRLFKRMGGLAETDPLTLQLHQHALKVAAAPGASTFALLVSALETPIQLAALFVNFTTSQVIEPKPFLQVFSGRHIVGNINVHFSRRTWDADKYLPLRKSTRDFLNGRQHTMILPIPCEVLDGTAQA